MVLRSKRNRYTSWWYENNSDLFGSYRMVDVSVGDRFRFFPVCTNNFRCGIIAVKRIEVWNRICCLIRSLIVASGVLLLKNQVSSAGCTGGRDTRQYCKLCREGFNWKAVTKRFRYLPPFCFRWYDGSRLDEKKGHGKKVPFEGAASIDLSALRNKEFAVRTKKINTHPENQQKKLTRNTCLVVDGFSLSYLFWIIFIHESTVKVAEYT